MSSSSVFLDECVRGSCHCKISTLFNMDFHGDLPIYTIDSFSAVPFGGNPAAVCLDPTKQGFSKEFMQKLAVEMNLPETAYIRRLSENDQFERDNRFGLRWFMPTTEVVLCGHATLAAAAVLFYCKENKADVLYFETLSGTLTAKRTEQGITLDLPLDPPVLIQDKSECAGLLKALTDEYMVQDIQYGPHNKMIIVRLKDNTLTKTEFENLAVPWDKLKASYKWYKIIAVILTIKGSQTNGCRTADGEHYDFISRFLEPSLGVEDPVTGAAHTILSPYWSKVLGKNTLYARQCSKRGGEMRINVREKDGRIDITGPATVMLKGTITV